MKMSYLIHQWIAFCFSVFLLLLFFRTHSLCPQRQCAVTLLRWNDLFKWFAPLNCDAWILHFKSCLLRANLQSARANHVNYFPSEWSLYSGRLVCARMLILCLHEIKPRRTYTTGKIIVSYRRWSMWRKLAQAKSLCLLFI